MTTLILILSFSSILISSISLSITLVRLLKLKKAEKKYKEFFCNNRYSGSCYLHQFYDDTEYRETYPDYFDDKKIKEEGSKPFNTLM